MSTSALYSLCAADLLVEGFESLALVDENLYHLSPLSTLIAAECGARPQTLSELAATCQQVYGDPPNGQLLDLVQAHLDQLADTGIVMASRI